MVIAGYICILLSILIFYYLIDTIIRLVGIQKSISFSFYELKEKGFIITFSLVSFSMLLLLGFLLLNYHLFELKEYRDILLIFFACTGISFTGAAAAYKKNRITNIFHLVGVGFGVLLGYAFLAFNLQYDLIVLSVIGVFLSHRYTKNPLFYDEIIAYCFIVYGIIRVSL